MLGMLRHNYCKLFTEYINFTIGILIGIKVFFFDFLVNQGLLGQLKMSG